MGKQKKTAGPLLSLLDFDRFPPSIERLPAAMTINSTTVYPTFRYKGGDAAAAGWAQWGYGTPLSIVGAGTVPTYNNGSPLLGTVDDSVKFNGSGGGSATGRTFRSAETSVGDVGTNDFVLELIIRIPTSIDVAYCKYDPSGTNVGWQVYTDSGTLIAHLVRDGGAVGVITAAWTTGSIIHAICFLDRSGSGAWYVNGVASGATVSISSKSGSLNSGNPFAISGYESGVYAQYYTMSDAMYYCAMWQGAAWLDTCLQPTVAQTRFAQLTGTYPVQARGTALPSVISGRTTAGYIDKRESNGTTKLYYIGAYWPRSCARLNGNSSQVVKGYLSEAAATNLCLQSQTFATTWTTDHSSVPTTAVACPDGVTRTTSTIHEDATAAENHSLYQSVAFTTGVTYVLSCYVKAANRTFVRLFADGAARFASCYFNLSTGAAGTSSAGTYGITSYGSGWYRCWVSGAATATASGTVFIRVAEADNDDAFDGLDQDSLYVFGAQVETGNYPSSYIPTTTGTVTRTADSLRYKMDDGNLTASRGSVAFDFLAPAQTIPAGRAPELFIISDGTDPTQIAFANTGVGSNYINAYMRATPTITVNLVGTQDVFSGNLISSRMTWQTDDVALYKNGTADGTDTSCAIPTGLTQLDVGAYLSAGYEPNGIITNLKIFGLPTLKT